MKTNYIQSIAQIHNLAPEEVESIIGMFLTYLHNDLEKKDLVTINQLGTFEKTYALYKRDIKTNKFIPDKESGYTIELKLKKDVNTH